MRARDVTAGGRDVWEVRFDPWWPLAALARVSRRTSTAVISNKVVAGSAILTGRGGALLDVLPTVLVGEARCTVTAEVVDEVVTHAAVGARLALTVIDVGLAEGPDKARHTATDKIVDPVLTRAPVQARRVGAVVVVFLAEGATKPWLTDAPEAVQLIDATSI